MFKLIKRCSHILQTSNTLRVNNKLSKCKVRNYNINTPLWNACDKTDEPDIQAITKGDPQLEHKMKVLLLEAEVMRQDGKNVPSQSFMKKEQWLELLKMETRSSRRKYLDFLFKIEKKKENVLIKKEQRRQKREDIYEPPPDGSMRYELGHNNILLRVYDTTMNQLYNNNLMNAMKFGQKLVIDCGYNDHMTKRENINCAKQLMLLFSENRIHKDPFDIHYCNVDPDSTLINYLHRHIPTMYEDWFPINLHKESYLDHFKKDELVYLTPHCREELTEYDHDAVYIVGGIVDKVHNEPVSLAKAKKEGLRMAKLPLDRYLHWGAGSGKSLTLNQVVSVLLDIKLSGDWNFALSHVPKRKLVNQSDLDSKMADYSKYGGDRDRKFGGKGGKNSQDKNKERLIKMRSIMYE